MKITRILTKVVHARMRNWIFVKVETDQPGLYGWGEATLEWKTKSVVGAVEDLSVLLIGQDPRRIEHLWQIMHRQYFWRGGIINYTAISGIDQALWDIKGKELNRPVHELLGGPVRDRLRFYDHLGGGKMEDIYGTLEPAEFAERAHQSMEEGFTAIKCMPIPVSDPVESPIEHATTNPFNPATSPGGSGWNSVTAGDLVATPKPFLSNMGNLVSRRYQVTTSGTASSLTLAELPAFSTNTVVDDIVFLKAQYGLAATASSTEVSSWESGDAAIDNTTAARVIAVRIGVVARSPLYEKDEVQASPTFSVLPAIAGAGTLAAPPAGECDTSTATMEVKCTVPDTHYRYRAYSTIVPLKNVIWTR